MPRLISIKTYRQWLRKGQTLHHKLHPLREFYALPPLHRKGFWLKLLRENMPLSHMGLNECPILRSVTISAFTPIRRFPPHLETTRSEVARKGTLIPTLVPEAFTPLRSKDTGKPKKGAGWSVLRVTRNELFRNNNQGAPIFPLKRDNVHNGPLLLRGRCLLN